MVPKTVLITGARGGLGEALSFWMIERMVYHRLR